MLLKRLEASKFLLVHGKKDSWGEQEDPISHAHCLSRLGKISFGSFRFSMQRDTYGILESRHGAKKDYEIGDKMLRRMIWNVLLAN